MTIWAHSNFLDCQLGSQLAESTTCPFCKSTLIRDHEDENKIETYETLNWGFSDNFTTSAGATIAICPGCGWWKYARGPTSEEEEICSGMLGSASL
jgi:hypothetical protein